MKKGIKRISPVLSIIVITILGFIAGVFSIVLWRENWLISDGVLNQEFIYKIDDLTIDKRALFFLCLEKRLSAFFLLFLLAFSSVNVFVNILYFFWQGLYIGSVLELFVVRYGMQGIVMYVSFVFPQGIFYLLGYSVLGCWCLQMEKSANGERNGKEDKILKFHGKARLMVSLICIFIGIMLESYVNSYFLKIFF